MPNIEIHGVDKPRNLALKIFEIFQDRPYVDEMVVTIHSTEVINKKCEPQPFLRLVNSHREYSQEIIEKLRTLNIDIEEFVLETFYPAKKPAG